MGKLRQMGRLRCIPNRPPKRFTVKRTVIEVKADGSWSMKFVDVRKKH